MRNRGGFTLLELLMVVIIIAILASIALPQYLRTAERARAAEALTTLAAIRTSQERFQAQSATSAYATTAQTCQLDVDIPGSGCAGAPAASPNWAFNVNSPVGNGMATRGVTPPGFTAPVTIQIDLATGNTCAPGNGAGYGLNNLAC